MRVLKFGGTSVGKPERMQHIAQLINDGVEKIVVLSAVSGTTNSLVEIHTAYKEEGKKAAHQLIDKLEAKYHPFIKELYSKNASVKKATALIKEKFELLRSFKSKKFREADAKIILAQGELISTHLFLYYVQEIGLNATLIPALDFMKTTDGEPDLKFIAKKLRKTLVKSGKHQLYITQGYICMNEEDEIDNLRRGGSDYTATLIGGALPATEIQIWTDIDGMHNTDPRVVKDTFPIHELSFDEAAELAYFGAKILHPSCVLPAQKSGVPVKLLNTMEPTAKGTVISEIVTSTPQRVKAIAAKDGITAIKIKSSRMLNAYGFLKKVFEIFEDYQTSIDMITTSEVAVSLTIDDDSNLKAITKALKAFSIIEIDKNQTIICVAGEFKHTESGVAAKVINTLKKIPLRMISSGGSRSNISILLDSKYKVKAMNALNEGLFGEILKQKRGK
ncbi:MAG: aspartate kinase [Saprospiraceae bacterium]